ncbi:MAG TPA: SAM-dependent methyltransferase [Deltaproteobacteria bacterium]|nr:SAM-dependent methyltransferase [Deltaproteobacteria bacterium]
MSTPAIYRATISCIIHHFPDREELLRHLDIGSGSGELVRLVEEHYDNVRPVCCDYTNELMQLPDRQVDIIDLNAVAVLPYDDARFDAVTATEVIEHLEDFRKLLREMRRVLRPGGLLVLSTPNILNLNSRLRNLWFGFAELMGPLPVNARKKESCAGHISPVSPFYIMHALRETGFRNVDMTVDRYQRSGMLKLAFLWIPFLIMNTFITRREVRKYKTIDASNRDMVRQINSLPLLLGRTVVLSAVK